MGSKMNYGNGDWHRWNGEVLKPAQFDDNDMIESVNHVVETNTSFQNIDKASSMNWTTVLKFRLVDKFPEELVLYSDKDGNFSSWVPSGKFSDYIETKWMRIK